MDKPNGNGGRARGNGRSGGGNQPNGGGRGRRTQQMPQGAGGDAGRAQGAWGNAGGGRPAAGPPAQSAWGNPNARSAAAPQAQSSWRSADNGGRGAPQPAAAPVASAASATAGPVQSAWGKPNAGPSPAPPVQSAWGKPNAGPSSEAPAPSSWRSPDNGGARGGGAPQPAAGRPQQAPRQQQAPTQQQAPPQPPVPAALRREVPVSEGAVGVEDTRGAVRGRRVIYDVVRSRPRDLVTKSGSTGKPVSLMANYFRILKKPNWSIHQYRVDFSPDVELIRLRRAYLGHHKELFGGYIFDGTVLFCANFIMEQADNNLKELLTKNREGETIQIKIKHVGIVDASDVQHIQVQNLIVRRAMEGLNLQLVGRNFFDPLAKINMDSYRMEIWPGYQTSIRQHERDILMCAEITHKVMRTENLYQILMNCCKMQDFQLAFKRQVVGTVVLTDYNNKTYRVDDVDFQSSPQSTFKTKDGEISYMEYYKKVCVNKSS